MMATRATVFSLRFSTSLLVIVAITFLTTGRARGQDQYDLRLVGGDSHLEGRVEMYVDGAWGTVCDDGWDIEDAKVVCRQLGYRTAQGFFVGARFGPGSGEIVLDEVQCEGIESRLHDCQSSTSHNCYHREDAGVSCSGDQYDLRLVGGDSHLEGRVEMYVDGAWGTVCDDGWDIEDAKVVCRQLGYGTARGFFVGARFGPGSGDIVLDEVQCEGIESRLHDCQSSTSHNCYHSEDAGVSCSGDELKVRLVDGGSDWQGRVEVYLDGAWGTICDDSWDMNDAAVICRQLGYGRAMTAPGNAYFGQGSGKIALDEVACTGSEVDLYDCQFATSHDCTHVEDASVTCEERDPDLPSTNFDVRLVSGGRWREGRVEVYMNGAWGTVCDDGWDIHDAEVVCRQLGYGEALAAPRAAYFGQGTGSVVFEDVACTGLESYLGQCHLLFAQNCLHQNDAGVVCSESDPLAPYTLRLVGGTSVLKGRVEVYVDGAWGTVCDNGWDLRDAKVVCRQLGYGVASSAEGSALFGSGEGDIVFDDVACMGSESSLHECRLSRENNCDHSEDAGVICSGRGEASDFDIRLVDGRSHLEGRVEVYMDGAWGTVCDDGWGLSDASVVCRQLGYGRAVSAPLSAHFGPGSVEIAMDDVQCTGLEGSLLDCPWNTEHNCGHHEDAGVVCMGNESGQPGSGVHQYDIQLVNGGSGLEGRVEVYVDGEWGTVCDDRWDIEDAMVVCRQLGYGLAVAAQRNAAFGEGTGAIVFDDVECEGTEQYLYDCPRSLIDEDCNHGEDAGVTCAGDDPSHIYTYGDVRLVDGDSQYEGRVEIYYNYQWGTICNRGWGKDDANVVCKQLGFEYADSSTRDAYYGAGQGPIWLANVNCYGYESKLIECSNDDWDSNFCSHSEDVGVRCNGVRPSMSVGAMIGIGLGVMFGVFLLVMFCKYCCASSKPTATTTATTTTARAAAGGAGQTHTFSGRYRYTQVPVGQTDITTPVVHYHPAQESVDVTPSAAAPPPTYDAVMAEPSKFPHVATAPPLEATHQPGFQYQPPPSSDPQAPPAGSRQSAGASSQELSNPTYELMPALPPPYSPPPQALSPAQPSLNGTSHTATGV